MDTGTLATRWNFNRIGGIASNRGLIQSVANSCLCLRSTADLDGTPIGLALCDQNDSTQQWSALQATNGGSTDLRVQNDGRGISSACLTEGANNALVQSSCSDTPNQVWSIKDGTGMSRSNPFLP
jgi:hypothetical protein